MTATTFVP